MTANRFAAGSRVRGRFADFRFAPRTARGTREPEIIADLRKRVRGFAGRVRGNPKPLLPPDLRFRVRGFASPTGRAPRSENRALSPGGAAAQAVRRTTRKDHPMTSGPTSPQLRQALAFLVRDAEQLERHLPGLHSRRRRPDRDGLRSIAPSGIPTHTVSDPTQAVALANLAADERLDGAEVTAATPDFVVVDHVIRCVLLAGSSLAEAVRALGLVDPALRPAPLPQCDTCGQPFRGEGRSGDCRTCANRISRHRTKETRP